MKERGERGRVLSIADGIKSRSLPDASPFDFPEPETREARGTSTWILPPGQWYQRPPLIPPPIPPAIPAGEMGGDQRTVAVVDICRRVIRGIRGASESFVHCDGRFWLYGPGYHYPVGQDWITSAVLAYDGAEGKNEVDGKPARFRYDAASRVSAPNILGDLLRASQLHVQGRYFDAPLAIPLGDCSLALDGFYPTPHSPEHRASWGYDVDYDPDAVPELLISVMRDWFAGLDDSERDARIMALRQYAGHTLLGTLSRMKLSIGLMLVGGGHDGKSAFIELLKACLPAESVKDVDPGELASKSLAVDITRASLVGKMANVCDDCTGQVWHDTGFLKRLLDHGTLNVRRQGKDPSELHWRGATVYACNVLPTVKDTSHGFQRRWRLIHFPNQISESDRDPSLVRKLISHERTAIINWFIRAAVDMLKGPPSAGLACPACHDELMSRWMAGDDGVAQFVRECCADPGADSARWCQLQPLYTAFCEWFSWIHKKDPVSRDKFSKRLYALKLEHTRTGKYRDRVVRLALADRWRTAADR